MVNFYVSKIESGVIDSRSGEPWKYTDVPPRWNKAVQDKLITDGYILNEDGTVEV